QDARDCNRGLAALLVIRSSVWFGVLITQISSELPPKLPVAREADNRRSASRKSRRHRHRASIPSRPKRLWATGGRALDELRVWQAHVRGEMDNLAAIHHDQHRVPVTHL